MAARIGKTRQHYDPTVGPPRGILRPAPPEGAFRHFRLAPPEDLAPFIEHFWLVGWDLRGHAPFLQETLPHPNLHLTIEPTSAQVYGIHTARFSIELQDVSRTFGIKFRAGAFHALHSPVSALANQTFPATQFFPDTVNTLIPLVASDLPDEELIPHATAFLRSLNLAPDPRIDEAAALVRRILTEPDIQSTEILAARSGLTPRTLQRLFRDYVGATPKWVIRRYRLHELVERLNSPTPPNWAQLAIELGYFDQAHLINDFKRLTGASPTRYPLA